MNNPLLSICIPTYNRANYLETTLDSIVNQRSFQESDDVEVIISDNCSTDNTQEISEKYTTLYGRKVRYYRNSENIRDKNFEKVLSYGQGAFLKLNNDTLNHINGSLDKMIHLIKNNIQNNTILFFSNGILKKDLVTCTDLNTFLNNTSYHITWIGSFGIWKTDLAKIKDFNRYAHLQLTQVDVIFNLFNQGKNSIIYNELLFNSLTPSNKGGYDFITVFIDNYFFLLSDQVQIGMLEKKSFILEKKRVLLNHVCKWMIYIKRNSNQYSFGCENIHSRIFKHFKNDPLTLIKFRFKLIAYDLYYSLKNHKLI